MNRQHAKLVDKPSHMDISYKLEPPNCALKEKNYNNPQIGNYLDSQGFNNKAICPVGMYWGVCALIICIEHYCSSEFDCY